MSDVIKSRSVAAAKEVIKNWHSIQSEGRRVTHEMAGGDPFGPSLSDFRDGDDHVQEQIAKIIEKHMRG